MCYGDLYFNFLKGSRTALYLVPAPFSCRVATAVHFERTLALIRILWIPSLALSKEITILEMNFPLNFHSSSDGEGQITWSPIFSYAT